LASRGVQALESALQRLNRFEASTPAAGVLEGVVANSVRAAG
jgi:hypothetical protein